MWLKCVDCAERNEKENVARLRKGQKPHPPGPVMFKVAGSGPSPYWLRCYMHWMDRHN
jgi:hypothetical protein